MARVENPVLQRELLVNLRMPRAFLLLFIYQAILALVVIAAWPADARLDLSQNRESTQLLIDLFFLGQFVLSGLMAPSFAAGAISGEKERVTYEMLLASPLRPEAIIWGKAVASLGHLVLLIFASLPIAMLCLPLGGVSLYEVLGAYCATLFSIISFGSIAIACSSYFKRTSASLVVSYLIILPLAFVAVLCWMLLRDAGESRLIYLFFVVPGLSLLLSSVLFYITASRLLYPPDVGSEGKEVVDVEEESKTAVGLVIDRNQFPDRLFAPPKRRDLMKDGANPVFDKEIHSEIFGQGTLMLRLVIQISMFLAIPMMAGTLFFNPSLAGWFASYCILFNVLVGPVFLSGSVSSERERQTLDLLLTTNITPHEILWGKLLSGLRVSSVLTLFLVWPMILAGGIVPAHWGNALAFVGYFLIIGITCLTTAVISMFCSTLFNKSVHAMVASYLAISATFFLPPIVGRFVDAFFPEHPVAKVLKSSEVISPFSTSLKIPYFDRNQESFATFDPAFGSPDFLFYRFSDWTPLAAFLVTTIIGNAVLVAMMLWLFRSRWRVSTG